MKNIIIEALKTMKTENMKNVKIEDYKYITYLLIKIEEMLVQADSIYSSYEDWGRSANFEQNILPLIEELEAYGYTY